MIDISKLREVINIETADGKKVYEEKLKAFGGLENSGNHTKYIFHGQEVSLQLDSGMRLYFDFKHFYYPVRNRVTMESRHHIIGENIPNICNGSSIEIDFPKSTEGVKFDLTGPISTFIAYDYFKKNSVKILKKSKNISKDEIEKIELTERRFINILRHSANLNYRIDENNEDDRLRNVVEEVQFALDDCFGEGKVELLNLIESEIENLLKKSENKGIIKSLKNIILNLKHKNKKEDIIEQNDDEIEM